MNHPTPQGLPPLPAAFGYLCDWGNDSLGLTRQTVYYGEPGSATENDWNEFPKVHKNEPIFTAGQMQDYAIDYAREALAAQAATLESIHKIIECAGPDAAGEIADLLGYPSVEWPSDQAAPSPEQAVGAEDEPWVVFDSQGYYAWHSTEVSAKEWCEHYNARSADDPLKPYVCRRISECAALQASRQPQPQQDWALDVDALATKEPK